jgi:hypothetical protein
MVGGAGAEIKCARSPFTGPPHPDSFKRGLDGTLKAWLAEIARRRSHARLLQGEPRGGARSLT